MQSYPQQALACTVRRMKKDELLACFPYTNHMIDKTKSYCTKCRWFGDVQGTLVESSGDMMFGAFFPCV